MAELRAMSFGSYLESSLIVLEREAPGLFARLREQMGTSQVGITIGDEATVCVCFAAGKPWVRLAHQDTSVVASVSDEGLRELLRGDTTIEEAVAAEKLEIRGPLDSVLSLLESLNLWLHGAVRCPSLPALHASFLFDPSEPHTAPRRAEAPPRPKETDPC